MAVETQQVLDTSGLSCPLPVLKSKKTIAKIEIGQVLKIISTDPGSKKDIPAWARSTGQELIESSEEDGKQIFLVRRLK